MWHGNVSKRQGNPVHKCDEGEEIEEDVRAMSSHEGLYYQFL